MYTSAARTDFCSLESGPRCTNMRGPMLLETFFEHTSHAGTECILKQILQIEKNECCSLNLALIVNARFCLQKKKKSLWSMLLEYHSSNISSQCCHLWLEAILHQCSEMWRDLFFTSKFLYQWFNITPDQKYKQHTCSILLETWIVFLVLKVHHALLGVLTTIICQCMWSTQKFGLDSKIKHLWKPM